MDMNTADCPDLLHCSPSEVAKYLLENRFQSDTKEAVSFFVTAARSLPGAPQAIVDIISQETNADASTAIQKLTAAAHQQPALNELPDLGPSLLLPPADEEKSASAATNQAVEVSLVSPRSKYSLYIQQGGLLFKHPKKDSENFAIPSKDVVDKMIIFPKPEACRRTSSSKSTPVGDMILLCFTNEVSIGKKKYAQICFQLPTAFTVQLDADENANKDDNDKEEEEEVAEQPLQGTDLWVELLCESLCIDRATQPEKVIRVANPIEAQRDGSDDDDAFVFSSAQEARTSTTTGGMPFVKCYHGIQDGVLYPLKEGLLFFKPPLFLSRDRLVSIASGRGASGSASGASSRYFDIIVEVQDKYDPELNCQEVFTGIAREELQVLNQYIHRVLIPAMKQDSGTNAENKEGGVDEAEEEEDDMEVPGKRNPRRKASVEAQLVSRSQFEHDEDADEDDEDEEDYNGGRTGDSAEEESSEDDDEEFKRALDDTGDYNNSDTRGMDDDDEEEEEDDLAKEEQSDSDHHEGPTKKRRMT